MVLFKRILSLIAVLTLLIAPASLATEDEEYVLGDLLFDLLDEEDRAEWETWESEVLEEGQTDEDAYAHLERMEDHSVSIDPNELDKNPSLPDDPLNILLLGVDARKDVTDIGLADVVMICSISRSTGEIKLTSIARDTCVTLPGYRNQNRLNTAYKFGGMDGAERDLVDGGPKLAMRTVNYNFDMNIEYFVTINFFGLAAIIESLGGVDIELTKQEANRINYELRKEPVDKVQREPVEGRAGMHHLDGMQAVTFARIRGLDNDLVRTSRQRKLIEVLLSQVSVGMNLATMANLMETALPYVYTNLPTNTIFELGSAVLASGVGDRASAGESLLMQHRVPMDKCFGYKDINGSSMIYLNDRNLKLNKDSIHKFIYGDVYPREAAE